MTDDEVLRTIEGRLDDEDYGGYDRVGLQLGHGPGEG